MTVGLAHFAEGSDHHRRQAEGRDYQSDGGGVSRYGSAVSPGEPRCGADETRVPEQDVPWGCAEPERTERAPPAERSCLRERRKAGLQAVVSEKPRPSSSG